MTASPMNPLAGPSGPGKFATRTDSLSFQSPEYGAGVEMAQQKAGAPLAQSRGVADNVGGRPSNPVVGLSEPTQRPDEPITAGLDMGPGPGSETLMMNQAPDDNNFRANITAYIPVLSYVSGLPSTSPETRKAIRQIMDQL